MPTWTKCVKQDNFWKCGRGWQTWKVRLFCLIDIFTTTPEYTEDDYNSSSGVPGKATTSIPADCFATCSILRYYPSQEKYLEDIQLIHNETKLVVEKGKATIELPQKTTALGSIQVGKVNLTCWLTHMEPCPKDYFRQIASILGKATSTISFGRLGLGDDVNTITTMNDTGSSQDRSQSASSENVSNDDMVTGKHQHQKPEDVSKNTALTLCLVENYEVVSTSHNSNQGGGGDNKSGTLQRKSKKKKKWGSSRRYLLQIDDTTQVEETTPLNVEQELREWRILLAERNQTLDREQMFAKRVQRFWRQTLKESQAESIKELQRMQSAQQRQWTVANANSHISTNVINGVSTNDINGDLFEKGQKNKHKTTSREGVVTKTKRNKVAKKSKVSKRNKTLKSGNRKRFTSWLKTIHKVEKESQEKNEFQKKNQSQESHQQQSSITFLEKIKIPPLLTETSYLKLREMYFPSYHANTLDMNHSALLDISQFNEEERDVIDLIQQDIFRTHQEIAFFKFTSVQKSLTIILFLWTKREETNQYCQGMNEILAPLFLSAASACEWNIFPSDSPKREAHEEGQKRVEGSVDDYRISLTKRDSVEFLSLYMFNSMLTRERTHPFGSRMGPTCRLQDLFYTTRRVTKKIEKNGTKKIAENEMKGGSEENEVKGRSLEITMKEGEQFKDDGIPPIVKLCEEIQDTSLQLVDKELHHILKSMNVAPQLYMMKWLRCLFAQTLLDKEAFMQGKPCGESITIGPPKWIAIGEIFEGKDEEDIVEDECERRRKLDNKLAEVYHFRIDEIYQEACGYLSPLFNLWDTLFFKSPMVLSKSFFQHLRSMVLSLLIVIRHHLLRAHRCDSQTAILTLLLKYPSGIVSMGRFLEVALCVEEAFQEQQKRRDDSNGKEQLLAELLEHLPEVQLPNGYRCGLGKTNGYGSTSTSLYASEIQEPNDDPYDKLTPRYLAFQDQMIQKNVSMNSKDFQRAWSQEALRGLKQCGSDLKKMISKRKVTRSLTLRGQWHIRSFRLVCKKKEKMKPGVGENGSKANKEDSSIPKKENGSKIDSGDDVMEQPYLQWGPHHDPNRYEKRLKQIEVNPQTTLLVDNAVNVLLPDYDDRLGFGLIVQCEKTGQKQRLFLRAKSLDHLRYWVHGCVTLLYGTKNSS
eukprot:g3484.t1